MNAESQRGPLFAVQTCEHDCNHIRLQNLQQRSPDQTRLTSKLLIISVDEHCSNCMTDFRNEMNIDFVFEAKTLSLINVIELRSTKVENLISECVESKSSNYEMFKF